jgi:hypothetical protein
MVELSQFLASQMMISYLYSLKEDRLQSQGDQFLHKEKEKSILNCNQVNGLYACLQHGFFAELAQ